MALKLMQGLYSFVLVLITALLARYFTEQGMISFYDTLDIPPGTPENHYFSYAWSGIYVLLFLSFYIVLRSRKTLEQFEDAIKRGNDAEIRRKGDGYIVLEVKKTIKYSTPA